MFSDVPQVLLHKLNLFLMSSWMNTMMQGTYAMCSILGALELYVLDGTQEGLSGIQKFLCGI